MQLYCQGIPCFGNADTVDFVVAYTSNHKWFEYLVDQWLSFFVCV